MDIITAINNNLELYPFLRIIEIKTDLNCRKVFLKTNISLV